MVGSILTGGVGQAASGGGDVAWLRNVDGRGLNGPDAADVVAVDSTDPRNVFHEVALHEARIATDHREYADPAPAPSTPSLVARVRLALAGGTTSTVEACSCPA